MGHHRSARQLALLGIILQILHVLFGITAILGVLIAHTRLASAKDTVYYSQIRWQITTFWFAFAAYLAAIWLWIKHEQIWLLAFVALFVVYRLAVSIWHWWSAQAIHRWL